MADAGTFGVGIGWRAEIAGFVARLPGLRFCEVVAENLPAVDHPLSQEIDQLLARGTTVVPHGVGLSLGSVERVDSARVGTLATAALRTKAPLVSEHIAFVRAGDREAGHLLPLPRTKEAIAAIVANIRVTRDQLDVPLALEPIAALFDWPEDEYSEPDFVREIVERTDTLLLLDVANVYANARNRSEDAAKQVLRFPLERLAYAHVAGGSELRGLYYDTHSAPVPVEVLDLVTLVSERAHPAGFLLERDSGYSDSAAMCAELDALSAASNFPRVTG